MTIYTQLFTPSGPRETDSTRHIDAMFLTLRTEPSLLDEHDAGPRTVINPRVNVSAACEAYLTNRLSMRWYWIVTLITHPADVLSAESDFSTDLRTLSF
ncbi:MULTISPECIES: hypothetical protein [Paraburkholderia]|uniref:hypothetical protein n=1 Tax=Paraburkholderia TaxID=1822464 RepID=UPI0013A6A137|nr:MULTISPECIES: hypothetical protein [Paraburkholderia]MDH6150937.1 hypothetical protein [Paraburkholderia sp. WSM4179]